MKAGLLVFILLVGFTNPSDAAYCLCTSNAGDSVLQKNIDYACGAGADCTPIQQNGACYNPNTVRDHCNYAVNSYFQKKGQATGSCDFQGTATVSQNPPNVGSGCAFPSSSSGGGGNNTPASPTMGGTATPTSPTMGGTGTGATPTIGGNPTNPNTGGSTIPGITNPGGLGPTGGSYNPDGGAAAALLSQNTAATVLAASLAVLACNFM